MHIDSSVEKLKTPEGSLYAGLPKFKALFGRDSLISSIALLDYDSSIALSTLKSLCGLQGMKINDMTLEEPGKIIHEIQQDADLINSRNRDVPWLKQGRNYFSVDSTPLYVILYHRLMEKDPALFNDMVLRNSVLDALTWIVDYGFKGNFLCYNKASKGRGLQSQSWRDGIGAVLENLKDPVAVVGVQGYAYSALKIGLKILERSGLRESKSELYDKIENTVEKLRGHFQDNFFLEETGYYALATDGDGIAEKTISSDPGHLLFSGILHKNEERIVIDRLFESDLMTDYGIRCLSSKSQYFDAKAYQRGSVWPHDNFLIAMGLEEREYHQQAGEIGKRVSEALELIDGFPEYYGVDMNGKLIPSKKMRIVSCDPQAWTAGAYYYFNRGH